MGGGVEIRPLAPGDSFEELTELLHRAYRSLADLGFRFVATYQNVETTRKRCLGGTCLVVEDGGRLVGTVTVKPPGILSGCEWYRQPGVAVFGQFAVDPDIQGEGLGARLLRAAEDVAREMGAEELALDTAEGASHLIDFYGKRGYRHVGYADWEVTNYRSVVMSKRLDGNAIPE